MSRLILIDAASGFIFGDTADRWWKMDEGHPAGPLEAAESLDRALMLDTVGLSYEKVSRHDGRATYHVLRADVDGSDTIPAVWDGQDQDMIDAAWRNCAYICTVSRY